MTDRQRDELDRASEPDRRESARHVEVALRSMGQPNSVASQFDFWNDGYEGRRLFSELLGTFFLVLVAVGGSMVNVRFGGNAESQAKEFHPSLTGPAGYTDRRGAPFFQMTLIATIVNITHAV